MTTNRFKMLALALALTLVVPAVATAQGVMFVTGGKVGIGTDTPTELLHLAVPSGTSQLKMLLDYGVATNRWAYAVGGGVGDELFRISLQGSGAPEVEIGRTGDTGNGGTRPTLKVFGSIEATNVTFSSSRALKTEIEPLNEQEILTRMDQLPLATWRYKTDQPSKRRIGPMAEDFAEIFGLSGNGETISMVDANGIALAAIKALAANNRELVDRVEELEAQLSVMQQAR